MKTTKTLIVSLLAIGLLVLSASQSGVIAQGQGGGPPDNRGSNNFETDTGEITVKVVGGGNVPMYTFYETDNNETQYRVMFKQVFEFNDTDGDGVYTSGTDSRVPQSGVALPSLSWDFSNVTSEGGTTSFNITSSDGIFTFANHIDDGAAELKFDVIISADYEWHSDDAHLALAFSLTNTASSDSDVEQEGNQVNFDGAFFNIEDTADDENGQISVGLTSSTDENDTIAYVSYEHFSGEMVHDPTMGVQAAASSDDTTTGDGNGDGPELASDEIEILWDFELSKGAASLTTFFASFLAVVLPVAIYRARRN